jgi:phospholipase/carboxylesterase
MALERQIVAGPGRAGAPLVVLLHGYDGRADDLIPFARSLGLPLTFVFPEGPLALTGRRPGARAWWTPDGGREEAIAAGRPRDLSWFEPEGLSEARAQLGELLDELGREHGHPPLVLGGFSQGAMLAFDWALREPRSIAALVQLSGSRIAARVWNPLLAARAGLPAFISHGRSDSDLSFAGAEAFKDDLVAAGWRIDFVPFDGGHQIPLVVWRRLKQFLLQL